MTNRSTAPCGRLNAFQRVMLQWSALHPYNAVHTYRLAGPLDLASLRGAIQEALDFNGLGVVEIDAGEGRYRHRRGDALLPLEIEVLAGPGSPEECLSEHLARELNRPFDRPRCRPFRFSVVEGGGAFHDVSLIYDHWTTDGVGARLLMRHVLGRYLHWDIADNRHPLDLYPGTYREVFGHRLAGRRITRSLMHAIRNWIAGRATWRPAYASQRQMAVEHVQGVAAAGTVERLRRFARANGASVHDVFLAALAAAMIPFLPKRSAGGRLRDLALGTIVDARPDANVDLGETLGTFLGYHVVRLSGECEGDLADWTRRVAAQTRAIKRRRGHLDAAVNLRMADAVWARLKKPERRVHFLRRAMPLTAGVSNVQVRDAWIERRGAGRILDFRRAVSCGPALPLVLLPTTFGRRLNVAITYRSTGFARSKIEGILGAFLERIETLDAPRVTRNPKKLCAT